MLAFFHLTPRQRLYHLQILSWSCRLFFQPTPNDAEENVEYRHRDIYFLAWPRALCRKKSLEHVRVSRSTNGEYCLFTVSMKRVKDFINYKLLVYKNSLYTYDTAITKELHDNAAHIRNPPPKPPPDARRFSHVLLAVYGVEQPSEEITVLLRKMLEKRLDIRALNEIQDLLLKNAQARLSPCDARSLQVRAAIRKTKQKSRLQFVVLFFSVIRRRQPPLSTMQFRRHLTLNFFDRFFIM